MEKILLIRRAYQTIGVLLFCFVFSGLAWGQSSAERIEQLERSTVSIGFFKKNGSWAGLGSGFVVAPGYVITNSHVTEPFQKYKVSPRVVVSRTKTTTKSEIIWYDKYRDVALLRVPELNAPAFELNTSQVFASQKMGLIGFPGDTTVNAGEPTYTEGVITKTFHYDRSGHRVQRLEYDAQSQPGSSGGPVVDMCGRVIGYHAQGTKGKGAFNRGYSIGQAIDIIRTRSPAAKLTISSNECIVITEADRRAAKAEAEARRIAQDLKEAEERRIADQEKREADEAQRRIEEAKKDAEEKAFQKRLFIGLGAAIALLSGLTLAALIFAMKKPKHPFVRSMSRMVGMSAPAGTSRSASKRNDKPQSSSQRGSNRNARGSKALGLSGFSNDGHKISLNVSARDLESPHGFSFGRSRDFVDQVLDDDAISKRHFRIKMERGNLVIEDLNSTNGTYVSGTKLSPYNPQKLRRNDRITIGGLELDVNI